MLVFYYVKQLLVFYSVKQLLSKSKKLQESYALLRVAVLLSLLTLANSSFAKAHEVKQELE